MKFGKEDLVKNQFWVLLGVYVPLMLIAIFVLSTAVASNLEEQDKIIQAQKGQLASQNTAGIGVKEFQQLEGKTKELQKQVREAWQKAWEVQKDVLTWPTPPNDMDPELKKQLTELKFGAMIGGTKENETNICGRYEKAYYEQIATLHKFFQTEVQLPNGTTRTFEPVAFLGGGPSVIRVQKDRGALKFPLSEEVWLLQEDLMVQHELLKGIRKANEYFSHFRAVEGADKPAAGEIARQRFQSSAWQVDLVLNGKDKKWTLAGKIKNLGPVRYPLGNIFFQVRLYKDPARKPVVLEVEGEVLEPNQEIAIKETKPYTQLNDDPQGLFGLEFLMEPRFSSVRRIDRIALNYESLRQIAPRLRATAFSIAEDPGLAVQPGGAAAAPGQPEEFKKSSLTPNGVERLRYCDITTQVRRRAFGLVLEIDQSRIPEILAGLASSKLHIQVTQVHWLHGYYQLEKKPKSKDDVVLSDQVVVAVYGIVSLYERYSDAPQPGKPPAPGTKPPAPAGTPPMPPK